MGVATPSVVENVSASSHAPSETSGGDMDLDSLDLRDNELDEVGSQPAVLSGEPLFEGGSESVSGSASVGTALVSQEVTSELVKNLKAVLPVSAEPAVDVQSPEFVVPLPPRVRQRATPVRTASRTRSRSSDERSPPVSPADPHRSSRSRKSSSLARPRSSSIPQLDHHC